ncbi:SDR family NAD(P)-dependent oxidoreductase [Daejeonella oryzae]|uniref:SDR family NAD(P)-dependent oxidoreductase n=1 Tax=Daejeonella oryzae TaxID=1122943 RepID=UPI000479780E|nr:SDR family oxidoreductase [Daejeonella oryzae]
MKTYIISGAGSGIGRAIATNLASQGNICILLGRDQKKLELAASAISGEPIILPADIRSAESLSVASKFISDIKIDGIIANAGIGGENQWGLSDRWEDIISTNLTGTYNFVNTFLPHLRHSESAFKHIILTSSVLARLGVANYSAYCASKAGLLGLMRSWAVQFAAENILVNAICPGWVDTEMSQDGLQGIADGLGISKNEFHAIAMESVPLRKMSQPEEIANLVSYLLGQSSMTGQTLDINNGAVMNS